ncbi:MAG TPA: DUF423 domain-containing protein [Caldithrix abyssi]|uniref:DUF423 domain-containing protein n=1 Tax=Caldithrix abyssi TaxID=187145 RepID=A0A7V4WUD5_CALAY|nr:DUF423 domain-containing protein [Caldithrix abyssi]
MKFWLISGAAFALLSVALGAFGAHALKNVLDAYSKAIYETAVQYQMFHALALLAVGILQHIFRQLDFSWSGYAFFIGILLFSGSLYILAVSGIRWLGAITPLGGVAFILGWAMLIWKLLKV